MIKIDLQIAIEDDRWKETLKDSLETFIRTYVSATLNYPKIEIVMPKHIEVSIVLTNDQEIQMLNREYRGKDKPTNVLSFPQETDLSAIKNLHTCVLLGDIVLSIETIQMEAEQQQKLMHHHLAHLIVHSVLHLIGYDHETAREADEMEFLEVEILQQHNIPNPYESDSAYLV